MLQTETFFPPPTLEPALGRLAAHHWLVPSHHSRLLLTCHHPTEASPVAQSRNSQACPLLLRLCSAPCLLCVILPVLLFVGLSTLLEWKLCDSRSFCPSGFSPHPSTQNSHNCFIHVC